MKSPVAVCIVAHPDDESWLCGGTLSMLASRGWHTIVVSLTRGERGSLPEGESLKRHAAVRAREFRRAGSLLSVAEMRICNYPDGRLGVDERASVRTLIRNLLERYKPKIVCTFSNDGLSGHPDHTAVASLVTDAVHSMRPTSVSLLKFTMSPAQKRKIGIHPGRPKKLKRIALSGHVEHKLRAIRTYRSQRNTTRRIARYSREELLSLFSSEYFDANSGNCDAWLKNG